MSTTTSRRRAAAIGAALAVAGGTAFAAAPSASAAPVPASGPSVAAVHKNGVCESGEFCLYYLANYGGPIFDLFFSDNDFSDDYFPTAPSIRVNDNTESFWNRDTYTWYACVSPNRGGPCGSATPGDYGNLSSTYKNRLSSAYWYL